MFTMEKVSIHPAATSLVAKGARYVGDKIVLIKWDDPDARKDVTSLADFEEGWQITLWTDDGSFSLRTSKITEIVDRTEDEMIFWTETSLYRLREVSNA